MNPLPHLYRTTLHSAFARPVTGDPLGAIDAFLALNAGYFLGEWLEEERAAMLLRDLARSTRGLLGLAVPADTSRATRLAQHVRELLAEFGPAPWLVDIAIRTRPLVPELADWDADIRSAATSLASASDGTPLLLAHARRRLWELTHPTRHGEPWTAPPNAIALATAAMTSDFAVQVAEAALAEASAHPHLARALLPALRTFLNRRPLPAGEAHGSLLSTPKGWSLRVPETP